jgi:hypothetical protein
MLDTGKMKKYLFYSIGEILLVVIGILIALQINNWNENRKDRIEENKVLIDLKENLEFNVSELEKITSNFLADDRSSKLIISNIQNRIPYHDSLAFHFARSLNADPQYVFSYIGYENMKNMGFNIIRNESLKKEIIRLFELSYELTQLRQSLVEDMQNRLSETIRLNFTSRRQRWAYEPFDYTALLENKEYLSLLFTMESMRKHIYESYVNSLNESRRVLELINDELGSPEVQ